VTPTVPVATHGAAPKSCTRAVDASRAPKPVTLPRAGSSVAVASLGGKTLAYVADEDDNAVHVIDVDAQKDLSTTPVGGRPSQLMFLPDGRLVVGVRDRAQLAVLEPGESAERPLDVRCTIETDAEPFGLALTPDGVELLVASGWGHALASYDTKGATMPRRWQVTLPREPRSVIVSDDGTKAFVSHAIGGQASVVDLGIHRVVPVPTHATDENLAALRKAFNVASKATGTNSVDPIALELARSSMNTSSSLRAQSCQGFALAKVEDPKGRVLLPQALVDPGDIRRNTSGYGNPEVDQTELGDIAVLDEASGDLFMPSLDSTDSRMSRSFSSSGQHDHEECLLPRAAAYHAKTKSLLVTCFGIDSVVAYDALAASPARAEKRRWSVAAGPNGIAVDPTKDRAIVWSQFERVLDVVPLGAPELVDERAKERPPEVARIAAAPPAHPLPLSAALGRVLFHMVGDERISHDGRACASCHPDGRDDGLTWATPNGPRRSIMLAGRISETAPFSWSGTERTLKEHMGITFTRLKGSGGLKSLELDALADYVQTLAPPPAAVPSSMQAKIARGSEIFHSEAAGCSSCHLGNSATDNQHHDVMSKTSSDKSGNFNTPSLKFVGGGGPYFHDGRYKTLHQLLTDADRKMGHTAQLSGDDLEALEAYLRSL
jgi:YVTN family beta-propeller protein